MFRTITIDETIAANAETTFDVITAKADPRIRIHELWFENAADFTLRGYVDQDRIVDVASEVDQALVLAVPVDRVLEPGEKFRVGYSNATGAAVKNIVVIIEEGGG